MKIYTDFDLTTYNTFGIAAKAAIFLVIEHPDDFSTALREYWKPMHILGGGSNLVLTQDIDWVVRHITYDTISENSITLWNNNTEILWDTSYITVGGGMIRNEFVRYTIQQWLRWAENLIAIPGCVWAAPVQNIGAYWVELQDICYSVDVFDIETAEYKTLSKEDCHFAYRHSVFKELPWKYCIYAVTFALSKLAHPILTYTPVAQALENHETQITQKRIADTIENIRRSKLPKPQDLWNSGSFFKNPIVSLKTLEGLLEKYPNIPHYPLTKAIQTEEQYTKLSAARLIDNSNLKWYREWAVGTYSSQPLVIVNHWWATWRDIISFSGSIIHIVYEKFGVTLEREVNIW